MKDYCPLCGSKQVDLIRELPKQFIIEHLESFYEEKIPNVDIINYTLYQCKECTLQFVLPEVSGTDRFYTWITHQPNYYPTFRWEWGIIKNAVLNNKGDASVMDIGCGTGDFLKYMSRNGISNLTGIDTSEPAIKVATIRGFNALCGNIYDSSFVQSNIKPEGYDYVVSFHCLEHVEGPLQFCEKMISFVKPGGKLFISTPYSPMSYESRWYDPLNHPPHHLSRWNFKSYNKLAELLNLNMRVHFPEASPALKRTLEVFNFRLNGFKNFYSRKKLYTYLLANPKAFFSELKKQKERIQIQGKTVSNVILVEYTLK